MLKLLINFLKEIARDKFESFVVLRDAASLTSAAIKVIPSDIKEGYFWDKQWEIQDYPLDNLHVNFPLLFVERGTRTITNDGVFDSIIVGLAISKQREIDMNLPELDPLMEYLYNNMTAIVTTIQQAKLANVENQNRLVTDCNPVPQRTSCDFIVKDDESIELIWTDTASEDISAVSAEIKFKVASSSFCFTPKPLLSVEYQGNVTCCQD